MWAWVRIFALVFSPCGVAAQNQPTLLDMRTELAALAMQLADLRQDFMPETGKPVKYSVAGYLVSGGGPLERLNGIEQELRRLTARSEELEYQLLSTLRASDRRLAALETRLCVLSPDCELSTYSNSANGTVLPAVPARLVDSTDSHIGHTNQFETAHAAYAAGNFDVAAQGFTAYLSYHPDGFYGVEANLMYGKALFHAGDVHGGARAFLTAFSRDRDGRFAADALYQLGSALADLGQSNEACVTLAELGQRFPGHSLIVDAETLQLDLGCP